MLNNKYDFLVVFSVSNANPNGDPLNGNRPRINYQGIGEVSDVCLKRKIRNRLMEQGQSIFVQSDDYKSDEFTSLKNRAENTLSANVLKDKGKLVDEACKQWYDVRAFGQLFAFKAGKEKGGKDKGVSAGIRGPVSIHSAFSQDPINITSIQITKSVNSEGDGAGKTSDTMGSKHRVDFGLYAFAGSINPQLAQRTGFDDEDAEELKKVLVQLFENDASSARPDGSMEVHNVYWWKHSSLSGDYSSAKVHRSIKVVKKEGIHEPKSVEDYLIEVEPLENLKPEVLSGF